MKNRAFKNQKETQQDVIDKIEDSQLNHSNNGIFVEKYLDDTAKDFTPKGIDKVADFDRLYSDGNPVIQPEMNRFCKQHSIDEDSIRKNKKMSLNQDIDHI